MGRDVSDAQDADPLSADGRAAGCGSDSEDLRLGALLEIASDGLVVVDRDGVIVLVNACAEEMFGFAREELVGRPVEVLVPAGTRGSHVASRFGFVADPGPRRLEVCAVRRDGSEFPVEITLNRLSVEAGFLVVAAVRDITERQRAEAQSARLAAAVSFSHEAIIAKTLDGVITDWNPAAERMYGYAAREAIGMPIGMLLVDEQQDEEFVEILRRVREGEAVENLVGTRRCQDGRVIDVELTISPVRDSHGRVVGASTVGRDVTARRCVEEELRQGRERLEQAEAVAQMGSSEWDLANDEVSWSPGMCRILQVDRGVGERAGVPVRVIEVVHDVTDARHATAPRSTAAADPAAPGRELQRPDAATGAEAEQQPLEAAFSARQLDVLGLAAQGLTNAAIGERLFICEGTVKWHLKQIMAKTNTTNRTEAVARVLGGFFEGAHRSVDDAGDLQRLADAAEYGTDAVVSIDLAGRVCHWNHGAERVYGFSAAEATGRDLRELTMLSDEPTENIKRVLAGETGYTYEAQRRRKDGATIDAVTTVLPWRVGGRIVGVTGVTVDVTERKRVEHAAVSLAAVIQASDDAILRVTPDGLIESWNPAAERLYGYCAKEAIGQPAGILGGPKWTPERLQQALAGSTVRFDGHATRRDGTIVEVAATLSPIRSGEAVSGVACIVRDATATRRAEQELLRLAEAAEYGSDSVISIDTEGVVRHWNHGAETLYGYSAEEAIGRDLGQLVMIADESRELERVLHGQSVTHAEVRRRRKDGTIIDVLWRATPWHLDGQVVGVTGVTIDITERKLSERAREQGLRELQEAQRLARIGSWSWDPAAEQMSWSAQMFEIFARDPAEGPAIGDAMLAYVHPDDRERIASAYAGLSRGGSTFEFDLRVLIDAAERMLHARGRADPARPACYLGTFQDVTEQRAAEQALRDAEERFRRTFDEAPIGMALISADGLLETANAALGSICARSRGELEGLNLAELVRPADAGMLAEAMRMLFAGETEQLMTESRLVPATDSTVDVSIHATVLRGGAGRPDRLLCQLQDVTERKRFESRLQFMVEHDPLSGLPNRRKFEAELKRHIAHIKRYGANGALLMLDLDHFKSVNDTLGHHAGDQLITAIASLLKTRVRASDILARLGGDEFGVLLPQADEAEAAHLARALLNAVRSNTALLPGARANVTASIGISLFDTANESLSSETALIEGDLAMYDAKEAGRDGYAFFENTEQRASRTQARLTWMSRIEQALDDDGFVLFAQPILDLRSGGITQYELLLRMLGHDGDVISPAAFLPVAERFELIGRIDQWVIARAIELIDRHPRLRLHVNISGKSLGNQKLLHTTDDLLKTSAIDPTHLTFEVTETAAIANITHAQTFAHTLRDRGCQLALDDFGAGFGSFYYLKHLPFDHVKIDGEFVQHAANGQIDELVIDAVVRVARGLGKATIAEFVTSEATQQIVSHLGVDYAQGYHIGMPTPLPDILEQNQAQSSSRGPRR